MCEQQYFIEYVLGYRSPSNKKADKGTIVHKVLEILAFIKQGLQDNLDFVIDDIMGDVSTTEYDLDNIIDVVYQYYSSHNSHHNWKPRDHKDCKDWVYKAISFNDGMFDPRNRHILQPEQHFDFEIDKKWADYSYNTTEGKLSGKLALKGTVDLITLVNKDTIEIVDWKTGRRLDWATGKEKTREKLEQKKGISIGKIAQKIISFRIGDDIKKINTKMSEKGISQVLIKQRNEPIGILTDKIILKILELEIKNPKVTRDFLDPLPPKIQYEDPINKLTLIFDLYSYVFVEKNGDIFGIVTRQDMIDEGFRSDSFRNTFT